MNLKELIVERVLRGNTTSSQYKFKYNPTGAVLNDNDEILVYYKDNKDNWFRDTFSDTGEFYEYNFI